jgi:hypothetical protein
MIIKISGATVAANNTQYSSGDLLGVKLTLTNVWPTGATQPVLTHITVQDLTAQKSAMDVIFFDSDPAATTFTNNGALDIDDADLPKIIAKVTIAATDYVDFADSSVATVSGLALALFPAASTLYACLVARGTPTYATSELSLVFGFIG